MNLTEAREALAEAVSAIDGVNCVSHPVPGNLRQGDAFVTVGEVTYGEFLTEFSVVLSALIILGSDEKSADLKLDALSVPLLQCAGAVDGYDARVAPQSIPTNTGTAVAAVYAVALSVTLTLSS